MTWLVWRQGRAENLLLVALLGALAVLLVLTGAHMHSVFASSRLAPCTTDAQTILARCSLEANGFRIRFDALNGLAPWLGLIPGLIGVLLAAPVVLDFEQGTYRLAWTQSITSRRWLTTRLALLLAGAVVCGLLVSGLATWWRQPLASLDGRVGPNSFDLEGIVPIAYTLFAAAAVLAIGTFTRRTGLAVAGGFGAYLVVRLVVRGVRQHLIPPLHALMQAPLAPHGLRHAWIINEDFTDPRGHQVPYTVIVGCSNGGGSLDPHCLSAHHVLNSFVYEPASRFWPLQALEAGIFVALSAAFIGLTLWWIRQRVA